MTRLSRPEHRFVELARRGYLIASIDYRLAQTRPFPAQLQDSKCAVRFLRSHAKLFGIDPEHIAVWGESCGGQLAALMAVREGIPALEDAREWTDVSDEVQAAASHGNDARHVTVPGQEHGYFEGDAYYQMIYDFLDQHLKQG